jgi:hypothetical protein
MLGVIVKQAPFSLLKSPGVTVRSTLVLVRFRTQSFHLPVDSEDSKNPTVRIYAFDVSGVVCRAASYLLDKVYIICVIGSDTFSNQGSPSLQQPDGIPLRI